MADFFDGIFESYAEAQRENTKGIETIFTVLLSIPMNIVESMHNRYKIDQRCGKHRILEFNRKV